MFKEQNVLYPNEKDVKKERVKGAKMTRRGFLKTATIFGTGVALGANLTKLKKLLTPKENDSSEDIENTAFREVEDDFWLSVIETVSRQKGEEITPQDVRAYLITKFFDIPQGWTSGLSTQQEINANGTIEQKRLYPQLDKLIATHFTNKTVEVEENITGVIFSTDFRDFRDIDNVLESFREEVEKIDSGRELGMKIYTILKKEYDYLQEIRKQNLDSSKNDNSVEFVYLPGGNPLFLRGYTHSKDWQTQHGEHLANTYKDADYIAIESGVAPIGEYLQSNWSHEWDDKQGTYAKLMKDLVSNGFSGLFFDIDARNNSKIIFDSYFDKDDNLRQVQLPDIFYEHYFKYLQQENPRLTTKIDSPSKLKQFLLAQTTAPTNIVNASALMQNNAKDYDMSVSISDDLEVTTLPTGNELGQMAFADAISALKLHILAQNMNMGNIKKGIIVDFEGSDHMSMKSFYLKYPQYAAEIVLRTIHEVMAGYVDYDAFIGDYPHKEKNIPTNLAKTQKIFENPPWLDIVQEINRIPMAYVENNPTKTVEVGPNQKKMKKYDKLDSGFTEDLDMDIIWALFDDKYIQEHIDSTKNK